ncbi:MAG TPA: hypothetical protein VF294_16950, partial [Polyangiaceae bacterium]
MLEVEWIFEPGRRLRRLSRLGRFAAQLNLLSVGSVCIGMLSGGGQLERREQFLRVDRVGKGLKQLERAQSPAQELQPLPVRRKNAQHRRPFFGDLAEQLEPGTVLEPFRGYDDLERIRAQQVEAVTFVGDAVDGIQIPKRSGDRQVAGGILVDDEHTHAANVTGRFPRGSAAGHGFHILERYTVLASAHRFECVAPLSE